MIEAGVVIFIGLLFLFFKLPKHWILVGLGRHLWVDIGAMVLAYSLHWGTLTGTMGAAVAGVLVGAVTSLGRRIVGYTYYDRDLSKWLYVRGFRNMYPDR